MIRDGQRRSAACRLFSSRFPCRMPREGMTLCVQTNLIVNAQQIQSDDGAGDQQVVVLKIKAKKIVQGINGCQTG